MRLYVFSFIRMLMMVAALLEVSPSYSFVHVLPPQQNVGSGVQTEAGLSQKLEQEILNLSFTQDLNVSDYFVDSLIKKNSLDTAINIQHFLKSSPADARKAASGADRGL